MQTIRTVTLLPLALTMAACASSPTAVNAPTAGSEQAAQAGDSSAAEEQKAEDQGPRPDVLYPAAAAVPAAPASCPAAAALPAQQKCDDARGALGEALALADVARDQALASLESCSDFEPGLIRALRAELADAACADVLVSPVVAEEVSPEVALPKDIRATLVALGLGARLHRMAQDPPAAPASREKEALEVYYKDVLAPWIESQASAIYAMAHQGAQLGGYAKGIVATESGNADMRFVEIARSAPISEQIDKDEEARNLYYATLDESLEPRKGRGSAAALVGLREMARAGVRDSERVAAARTLLSRAYGGRRINALDTLLLPQVQPEPASDAAAAIASRVPTVYASALVGPAPADAHLVRAHIQMGIPLALRREVEATKDAPVAQLLLARALFESGRTYFRAQDFQDANALLTTVLDSESATEPGDETAPAALSKDQRDEAVLLRALCVALLAGPKDAAEMIAQGPRFADALGNLVLLDGLAEGSGELAGRAAFDAAYLRELVINPADPDGWKDLATRYSSAAKKLKGKEAQWAKDRAKACADIEKAVRAEQKTAPRN